MLKDIKNTFNTHFSIIFLFILLAGTVGAVEFVSDDNVHISNIHTIDDDLFAWGKNITIDGEIRGDLIAGGSKITTNGYIDNSVNVFASDYSHSGEINGSIRAFVAQADIDGYIERSAMFFAAETKIGKNSVINKDLYFFGGKLDMNGTVHGDVEIKAGDMSVGFSGSSEGGVWITGTIDGNLTIESDNIHILPPALIKGDFKYISTKEANIDTKSGVTILGNTYWDLPVNKQTENESTFTSFVKTISKFLAAFIFGIIIMALGKSYIHEMVHQVETRFAVSLATGSISVIIFLLSIAILFATLILLIVGLALISEGETIGGAIIFALSTLLIPITSFLTVSGGIIFYSGKIILGLFFGYWFIKKIRSNAKYLSKGQLLLGLLFIYLLCAIP